MQPALAVIFILKFNDFQHFNKVQPRYIDKYVSTVLYEEISVCLCLIQNIESYELNTVRRKKGSNHKPRSVFRVLLS